MIKDERWIGLGVSGLPFSLSAMRNDTSYRQLGYIS
jgi:hypothetical protein